MSDETVPEWYDESKQRHVYYAVPDYTGYVIDLGDGTCRYINDPLLGCDDENDPLREQKNRDRVRWGDRVRLMDVGLQKLYADSSTIIERYQQAD